MTEISFTYSEVVLNDDTEERISDRIRLKGVFDVFMNGKMLRVSGAVKTITAAETKHSEGHKIFQCKVTVEGKSKRYGRR